jgi:hypothetical protein
MFVCCECCVLSGRGLGDGLITRPEESCRLWCIVVCDQETSKTRRLKPATGLWKIQPQWVVTAGKQTNKQTDILVLYVLKEIWCQLSEDGDIIVSKSVAAVYKIVRTNYRILRLLVVREIFTASWCTE